MFLLFLSSFLFIVTFWPFCKRTFGRKMTNFTINKTFERKFSFELAHSLFEIYHKVGFFFIIWDFTIARAWAIFSLFIVILCILGGLQCYFLSRWIFLSVLISYVVRISCNPSILILPRYFLYLRDETLESHHIRRDLSIFWISVGFSTFSPRSLMILTIYPTQRM